MFLSHRPIRTWHGYLEFFKMSFAEWPYCREFDRRVDNANLVSLKVYRRYLHTALAITVGWHCLKLGGEARQGTMAKLAKLDWEAVPRRKEA